MTSSWNWLSELVTIEPSAIGHRSTCICSSVAYFSWRGAGETDADGGRVHGLAVVVVASDVDLVDAIGSHDRGLPLQLGEEVLQRDLPAPGDRFDDADLLHRKRGLALVEDFDLGGGTRRADDWGRGVEVDIAATDGNAGDTPLKSHQHQYREDGG